MRIAAAQIFVCASLLLAHGVRAEPPAAALVVGNGAYATLPPVPACARSAHVVAAALRALGFDITEREDASSGGTDGAISEFSRRLADGRRVAVVYVCGYGTSFNNRPFLLPTTANIARPSDVLTQGVLAKSLLDTVGRDAANVAVVAFDLVPKPDGPPQLGLDTLAELAVPDGVGLIAVAAMPAADVPTPLATALVAGLAGPTVRSAELMTAVQEKLTASKTNVAAIRMPARSDYLAGAPPAAEPPKPIPAAPVAVASQPPPAPPSVAPSALAPPASPSPPPMVVTLPDEAQMTEDDRRKVQAALGRLGYYGLPVDGKFGPETRAAIRRYQHEINAEMTGRLTAAEASRLVGNR